MNVFSRWNKLGVTEIKSPVRFWVSTGSLLKWVDRGCGRDYPVATETEAGQKNYSAECFNKKFHQVTGLTGLQNSL